MCIRMQLPLVIVLVIDHFRIRANKPESDSPITADPNGPGAFPLALQGMKPKARKAHVPGFHRRVEAAKDQAQPIGMS